MTSPIGQVRMEIKSALGARTTDDHDEVFAEQILGVIKRHGYSVIDEGELHFPTRDSVMVTVMDGSGGLHHLDVNWRSEGSEHDSDGHTEREMLTPDGRSWTARPTADEIAACVPGTEVFHSQTQMQAQNDSSAPGFTGTSPENGGSGWPQT